MLRERVVPEQERLVVSLITPTNKVVYTLMSTRCAVISPLEGDAVLIGTMPAKLKIHETRLTNCNINVFYSCVSITRKHNELLTKGLS